MARRSKRYRKFAELVPAKEPMTVPKAIDTLKTCPPARFDETMEVSIVLGVDPRKSDQQVRGTVSLPHGTGKSMRVLVFAKGPKAQEALQAGATYAGDQEFFDKVNKGWTDFDAVVATPDMMREVGKLGKVLGPRGLMPSPKAGTVTNDVGEAVRDIMKGKIEFKTDRRAVVNNGIGKMSFDAGQLADNFRSFLSAIVRAKPASSKGQYVKSVVVSSTMGPGIRIDLREEAVA